MTITRRTSWTLWLLLTAFAVFHAWSGLQGLPPYLATHFDGAGTPNGWMSPTFFSWFMAGMWTIMTLAFWGPRFLLPRISTQWFNLPHKEYWLAPERREAALDRISVRLEAFGLATLAGMVLVTEVLFQVNRTGDPMLPGAFGTGFVVYIAGSLIWGVAFMRAFRLPPGAR